MKHQEPETYCHKLMRKFIPKQELLEISKHLLKETVADPAVRETEALRMFNKCYRLLARDAKWKERLELIFGNVYPPAAREFLNDGEFAVWGRGMVDDRLLTYKAPAIEIIKSPSKSQSFSMAPIFVDFESTKSGRVKLHGTVNLDRFLQHEKKAMDSSALVEIEVLNRPFVGMRPGWKIKTNQIPRKTILPKVIAKPTKGLLTEFKNDISHAIAWSNGDSLATYYSYLLQPMLMSHCPGVMPCYFFTGATQSGKGFLSTVLPAILYASNIGNAVFQKKIANTYEMEVSLVQAQDSIYYVFDEIKDASEGLMKVFDHVSTAPFLQVRKILYGQYTIKNYFTFALTGVTAAFSDESLGRLARIELKESRVSIQRFFQKWTPQMPTLLATMHYTLKKNFTNFRGHSLIKGRRPGFGLMADATESVFNVRPLFALMQGTNDVLESVCALFNDPNAGDRKGKDRRLTPKTIRDHFNQTTGAQMSPRGIILALKTGMANGNSKQYAAEDGSRYQIRLNIEGREERAFVYVREINEA